MNKIPNEIIIYEIGKFLDKSDIQILRNVNSHFYTIFNPQQFSKSYLVQYYYSPLQNWLNSQDCKFSKIIRYAVKGGHLNIIKKLYNSTDCNEYIPNTDLICHFASRWGHLDIIKWAISHGCPLDIYTPSYAASGGHLHVLQWLYENKCPWDSWTCAYAAKSGHLNILQWLIQNGCPWNINTSCEAARNGHLHILKWLKEKFNYRFDIVVSADAAYGGHLEILKWLRENGCPWDSSTITNAEFKKYDYIVEWAKQNGCPEN